jgi:hypothetical protein
MLRQPKHLSRLLHMSTCQGDSSYRAALLVDLYMQWSGLIKFNAICMAFASFQRGPWYTAYRNGYMRAQAAPLYPADVPRGKYDQVAQHVTTVIARAAGAPVCG